MHNRGRLILSSGVEVVGNCLFDSDDVIEGEVVFSTSTTGYTEILTDPSFHGQIVVLANPEVGNYGVSIHDFQSPSIKVAGLVVRNLSTSSSSFRAHLTLADFLLRAEVPVLYGVDTRALITMVRDHGSQMAVLTKDASPSSQDLLARARALPPLDERKLSDEVSVRAPARIFVPHYDLEGRQKRPIHDAQFHVVALDFGVKTSLLRCLQEYGATVTLMPSDSSPEEVWALEPDGLFLTNGPGDPSHETMAIATVRSLIGKLPIFGVCMGHQILARAVGLTTYKLKFGHRGSNQAVRRSDGTIITTAQNHGFAVAVEDYDVVAENNVSDGTNEGLDLVELHAFSVQFHPEGAPGPLDGMDYFAKFAVMMKSFRDGSVTMNVDEAPGKGAEQIA